MNKNNHLAFQFCVLSVLFLPLSSVHSESIYHDHNVNVHVNGKIKNKHINVYSAKGKTHKQENLNHWKFPEHEFKNWQKNPSNKNIATKTVSYIDEDNEVYTMPTLKFEEIQVIPQPQVVYYYYYF